MEKYNYIKLLPYSWLFTFLIYTTGGISYNTEINYIALAYALFCVLLVIFGYYVGCANRVSRFSNKLIELDSCVAREINNKHKLYLACSIMGLIASILFLYDASKDGLYLADLVYVRERFIQSDVSTLRKISTVLAPFCYISFGAYLISRKIIKSKTLSIMMFLSGLSVIVFSIFSAGRQSIFLLVVMYIVSVFIFPKKKSGTNFKKLKLIIIIFITLAYSGYIAIERNDETVNARKYMVFESMLDANLNQFGVGLENALPNKVFDSYIEAVIYFGHSYPMYFEFWDTDWPGPYFGMYQLNFMSRQIDKVMGQPERSIERWDEVRASFSEQTGYYPNVWMTSIKDMLIDFGHLTLLMCLLVGYLYGKLISSFLRSPSIEKYILILVVLSVFVVSPLFNPIKDMVYLLLIIFTMMLIKIEWMFKK